MELIVSLLGIITLGWLYCLTMWAWKHHDNQNPAPTQTFTDMLTNTGDLKETK